METDSTTLKAPGPKSHWLLGLLRAFLDDTLGFLASLEKEYGPVSSFRILRVTNYLVSDPELVEQVLKDKSGIFIKNTGFFRHFYDLFGAGLLTAEGEHWKRQRKIAAPVFRQKNLDTFVSAISALAEESIKDWGSHKTLDFHQAALELTAQIASKTLFGVNDPIPDQRLIDSVRELEKQIAVRIKRPFMFQDKLPVPSNIKYKRALHYVEEKVYQLIDAYQAQPDSGTNVLSQLVNARYEDGTRISRKQLRDDAITLYLAGHDTTAILLSWMFYLLSQHPAVIAALRREWSNRNNPALLNYEAIKSFPLTNAVIKESLRLYPPAYILGRQTTQAINIGGYHIPKGAPVVVSPYVLGRLQSVFESPDRFLPERWLNDDAHKLEKAFLPFGGGPRICIGDRFAQMEAAIILMAILRHYDPEYVGESAPVPLISINMPPKDGMLLKFSRIQ